MSLAHWLWHSSLMPFFLLHPAPCCSQGVAECQRGTGQGVKARQMEPEHRSVSQYVSAEAKKKKGSHYCFCFLNVWVLRVNGCLRISWSCWQNCCNVFCRLWQWKLSSETRSEWMSWTQKRISEIVQKRQGGGGSYTVSLAVMTDQIWCEASNWYTAYLSFTFLI